MKQTPWIQWAILAAIVLAGIIARSAWLDENPRFDEITTFEESASQPVAVLLSTYKSPNNHVFHSLLAGRSLAIFGDSLVALRLPAFLAGILLIPLLYRAALNWGPPEAALWSAAMAAGSPLMILYSTNARGYSWLILFVVLLLHLGNVWLDSPRFRTGVAWAFLSGLGFWTIPIMAIPWGVLVLWLLIEVVLDRQRLKRLAWVGLIAVASISFAGLMYLPILLHEGWSSLAGNRFIRPEYPFSLEHIWIKNLGLVARNLFLEWGPVAAVPIALASIAGFLVAARRTPRLFRLGVLYFGVSVLTILILKESFQPRFLLFLLPVLFLFTGVGIARIIDWVISRKGCLYRPIAPLGWALLTMGSVVSSHTIGGNKDTGGLMDARQLISWVEENLAAEDGLVLSVMATKPFQFIAEREAFSVRQHPSTGGKLFVLVQDNRDESLGANLRRSHLPYEDALENAAVVQKWPSSTLYEMSPGYADQPFQYLWQDTLPSDNGSSVVSPWYGEFEDYHFPWILHYTHGWQVCQGTSTEALWVFDRGLDLWFYTTEAVYPWIYLKTFDTWLYYLKESRYPNRWFADSKDAVKWTSENDLRIAYGGHGEPPPPPPATGI